MEATLHITVTNVWVMGPTVLWQQLDDLEVTSARSDHQVQSLHSMQSINKSRTMVDNHTRLARISV